MKRLIIFSLSLLFPLFSIAAPATHHGAHAIKRVIYITVDGVRWQDIFQNRELLAIFWQKYATHAAIYGEPDSNRTMEVASIPVSLPSYQSQMAGVVTGCGDNECGRLAVPTLAETLVHKAGLNKKDVASISCWEVMDNAFESVPGTGFSNHGTRPMSDPDTQLPDDIMVELNKEQAAAYPGDDTRPDKYTFAQAMHYLEKYQPRFLWISFGDADDHAHDGNLPAYQNTIRFYDQTFDELFTKLKALHLDEETMVIITTDHGRGDGDNWLEHGEEYPESKRTWAFVFNGELAGGTQDGDITHYSTLSIRPTIEQVFTAAK